MSGKRCKKRSWRGCFAALLRGGGKARGQNGRKDEEWPKNRVSRETIWGRDGKNALFARFLANLGRILVGVASKRESGGGLGCLLGVKRGLERFWNGLGGSSGDFGGDFRGFGGFAARLTVFERF